MDIENLIFHKLEKHVGQQSSVTLREEVLPVNEQSTQFVQAVTEAYERKSNIYWGYFDANVDSYPFQTMLDDYLQECSPESFLAFSKRAVQHLQKEIDDKPLATGGYIVFVHFIEDAMDFVICAILQDKEGFTIDPDTLALQERPHLAIDQLRVASRINVSVWKHSIHEHFYVSFLQTSGDVSRYFKAFIGCTEDASSGDLTQKAIDATRDHLKSLGLPEEEFNDRFEMAMDHMMDKARRKESIQLDSLAQLVNQEDPESFIQFATGDGYDVSREFKGHKSSISASSFILLKNRDMTIRFHQSFWGHRVKWHSNTGEIIIKVPDEFIDDLDALDE